MYEMWKRKQKKRQEDAQDRSSCQKVWENGEGDFWEVVTWSEEWIGRVRYWYGAESVRDTRGKEWDRNT